MNEIYKEQKTRYPSIVPQGSVGTCTEVINAQVFALKIKFDNGEEFWFMRRDLEEV